MKTQKITIALLLLFLINQTLFSQEFEVPKNVKLENSEDYKKYEKEVLQGINWLENTAVNQQVDKRKETAAFLMIWMTGTSSFTIRMESFQIGLTEKNPDLLTSFLGGWTKFVLENPSEKDDILNTNIAGVESIIKVYNLNKGKGIKKDKKIEKLVKLDKTGLKKWVKKQLER